jgi:hypothetical protein
MNNLCLFYSWERRFVMLPNKVLQKTLMACILNNFCLIAGILLQASGRDAGRMKRCPAAGDKRLRRFALCGYWLGLY